MKKTKENKGITLIALVITIIVMLILVAVTINVTTGDNGLFGKAKKAAAETNAAIVSEQEYANNIGSIISSIETNSTLNVNNVETGNNVTEGNTTPVNTSLIVLNDITYMIKENNEVTVTAYTGSSQNIEISSSIVSEGITYTVVGIESQAFRSKPSILSVTISNGIRTIGSNAFGYCGNLTSVQLPNSLTDIGDECFTHCENLETVTFLGTVSEWTEIIRGVYDVFTYDTKVQAAGINCSDGTGVTYLYN